MERNCASLPLSALRLLVPPIRLVSAAVWQTVQLKVVADYGLLEEFVSMVTDMVPGLLTYVQRAQLVLGLRARLILDLCQFETDVDLRVVQPHLDRVQTLIRAWGVEAGATPTGVPHSEFVDLVKNLVKNPAEREHFFQTVFPEDFGPKYDEALHTLTWMFLSRLEKFLPLHTFQQVASMFDEASPVLEECMDSVSQCDELKTLLHYQKHFSQLDPTDGSFDGSHIISALKLPSVECLKTSPLKTQLKTVAEDQTNEKQGYASRCLKQCRVRLGRVDKPWSRPVRRNRGRRMEKILLEEKRSLGEESLPAYKAKRTTTPSMAISSKNSYMAPIKSCSGDKRSHHSDENSCHKTTDSWSNYSDNDPSSSCSDEDPSSSVGPQRVLATSKKQGMSDVKASTPKKPRKVQCFICREPVKESLRSHMKSHFPTGDYACPRCDSRFKLYSSFRQHLRRTCFEYIRQKEDLERPEEAQEDLYRCDQCHEAFRYKVSIERHKLTHNELYCSVCRKVLRDAATLARHKASHTPYQCNRCNQTFALFKPLLRHYQNIHEISKPFKCNHCPKAFSRLRVLIAHEWKHTGHLPFQCAQCGSRFKTDGDLISHERVHTREKPYLCADCGKTFSQKSNLLRHQNLIHGESRDQKRHACSECEKSFKERGALKKHQRSKHLKELFRQQCTYCGKMVAASTVARHKLIHTGERPFKCTLSECDKHFRSSAEVKRHVLMHHTTDRPYKCHVCGKGFIKMCILNAHAKVHSGEKPFVCHICGKAFPKLYSMQRHKKLVHTFVATLEGNCPQ